MAEEKKHYIRVPEALVEVTEEVYRAYYQEDRYGRTVEEKDQRNGLTSYDELDTEELTGQEMVPDRDAVSVEDAAISLIMQDKLHSCLLLLDESDKILIYGLYYKGLSERKLSKILDIPQQTISDRKLRALARLKKFLEK